MNIMPRSLVIDDSTCEKIAALKALALEQLLRLPELETMPIGMPQPRPNLYLKIFDGFHINYLVEQQPDGWCRHLIVCVGDELPEADDYNRIVRAFGMRLIAHFMMEEVRENLVAVHLYNFIDAEEAAKL